GKAGFQDQPGQHEKKKKKKIIKKYPNHGPLVVVPKPHTGVPGLTKRQYVLPLSLTISFFFFFLRKRDHLRPKNISFFFLRRGLP
uniref:Uncharacterized protein n=1 Tax=Pongo abelii TaxID=9601 RepID=A0A8I5U5S7_PONAB